MSPVASGLQLGLTGSTVLLWLEHMLPTLHAAPSACSHPLGDSHHYCPQSGPHSSVEGAASAQAQALGGSSRHSHQGSGAASSRCRAMLTGAVDSPLSLGVSSLISIYISTLAHLGPCLCQPVICQELETGRLCNGKVAVRLHYFPTPYSPDKGYK